MQYLFLCRDQADSEALRQRHLDAHLAHIEKVMDQMVLAGPCPPVTPDDQRQFAASLLIIEADSPESAEAVFKSDPYYQAGVWDSYEMRPFLPVAGQLVGGKTW